MIKMCVFTSGWTVVIGVETGTFGLGSLDIGLVWGYSVHFVGVVGGVGCIWLLIRRNFERILRFFF